MLFDLSKVRTARGRHEEVYAPDAFASDPETFRIVAPVSLAFDIFKDRQQFRLIGTVRTTLGLLCSRCLEAFEWPVEAQFDLHYQPHTANLAPGNAAEREIEEDDLSTAFYENDEIDLGQLMREQLYLTLPMKPLCREDCPGLCPACGTNLNRDSCQCKREWEDPRFAALKMLKKES